MRNIELKARLRDRERARGVCAALGAAFQGHIHQVDTYFRVRDGRLKLRVNEPGPVQLVFYRRPDRPEAKGSDYTVEPVSRRVGEQLREALGALVEVDKVRTLYLWDNVRIHLDWVKGLGDFIEFEAVLSETYDEADGRRKLACLREAFGIAGEDRLPVSYADLMLGETLKSDRG